MKDKKKVKRNFIIVSIIVAVYMILAYMTRGYYAVGLEIFTPLFLYVAWLYSDKDTDKYA